MSSKPEPPAEPAAASSEGGKEEAAPSNAELAGRVDALDSKLDTILDKLGGGTGREGASGEPKGQPASVADEIRRQLDDQRKADEAKAAAEGDAAWRKGVDDRLAGMAEAAPEPPVRRVEKLMGWRG